MSEIRILLREVRIALKRPRMIPNEKRMLLARVEAYLNRRGKKHDSQ